MMRAYKAPPADVRVPCPLCAEPVRCWLGDDLGLNDFAGCECYDSPLVRQDAYREALAERARDAARSLDDTDRYDTHERV